MLHEIYYNIGVVEVWHCSNGMKVLKAQHTMSTFSCVKVQDQIDVTKQLVDLYPFIDKSRVSSRLVHLFSTVWTRQVAIWGWSYGGFVTASVLAADADQSNIFKVSLLCFSIWTIIDFVSVRHQRCSSHQLDLLRFHLHGEVAQHSINICLLKYAHTHTKIHTIYIVQCLYFTYES